MKYSWEKGLKKLIRKSPEINALAGYLAPEIRIAGVVFSNGYEGCFVPLDFKPRDILDADVAQDAMGDLDFLRCEALSKYMKKQALN